MGKGKRCRGWMVGRSEWGKKNKSWRNTVEMRRGIEEAKAALSAGDREAIKYLTGCTDEELDRIAPRSER